MFISKQERVFFKHDFACIVIPSVSIHKACLVKIISPLNNYPQKTESYIIINY
jgi:hypothetical protein